MGELKTGEQSLTTGDPRRTRRWRHYLAFLALGLALLFVAARLLLGSRHVAGMLATRLERTYGGRIQLDQADIGLGATTLHGLQLFEPGAKADAVPWVEVGRLDADVSIVDALKGDAIPKSVTAGDVWVRMRFDSKGKIETRLPKTQRKDTVPLPPFTIQHGRFTLQQDGHPALDVQDIDAEVRVDGNRFTLTGTTNDARWGQWAVDGWLDQVSDEGLLHLKTGRRHVTQAVLDTLPFVPADVWEAVQFEGNTSAEITVRFHPGAKPSWRVELEPDHTSVHVTAIDLLSSSASGKAIIENGIVTLKEVEGPVAEGRVFLSAQMDFHTKPTQMDFQLKGDRIDIARLPKKWKLPAALKGRFQGQANLHVTVKDKISTVNGTGAGIVTDGSFGLLPLKNVAVEIEAENNRFSFKPIWRKEK